MASWLVRSSSDRASGFEPLPGTHRRTGTIRLGGGGALFARKNYAVPHCLIVEISYFLPQNVRKNMRLQSLKGIKLYVIETQFLEPHILYVGLLDLVTIE